MPRVLLFFALVACATPPDDDDGEDTGDDGGACGEATTYDVVVRARVEDAAGGAAEGITVVLDDRGWTYTELGSGTTGADGEVEFTAVGVTALANCWGTVLNYQLVATDPADETRSVEDDMNPELHAAIDDGSLLADVRDFPLTLP